MSELAQQMMTREQAERLTERIRHAAASFVEAKEKLTRFIGEAQEGRAWEALGYASWTAYTAAVFSDTPLMRLSRDERRELVSELSEAGMSTRAIAPIVGADQKTVVNDNRATREEISSPTPERRTATFQTGGGFVEPGEKIVIDTETTVDLDTGETVAERPITGMDGKTYTVANRTEPKDREEPHQPPRKPIKRQFFETVSDLTKAVKRLDSLTIDDRFPSAAQDLGISNKSDIDRAIQLLTKISTQLEYNI